MVSWLDRKNRIKISLYLCEWSLFFYYAFCGEIWEQHCLSMQQSQGSLDLENNCLHEWSRSKWQISQKSYTSCDQQKVQTKGEGVIGYMKKERASAGSQLRELTAVSLLISPVDRKLHTQCWSFVPPLWVTWMGENLICLHLFVISWRGHSSGAILHMYFCTSFCISSCSYLHIWTHSPLLSFHILPERYPYQKYFGHA